MAFSKTPVQSTYQTKMVPLLGTQFSRNNTPGYDTDFFNVFVELVRNKEIGENDYHIVKRPGTNLFYTATDAESRGIYFNADFQKLYWVVGDTLYIYNIATTSISNIYAGFFSTITGEVGFTDYLYDNGTQTVVLTDGTSLKMLSSTDTVTTCTAPDLPVPHQPYPVFLDGYIFLLKTGTGDLYNSNLNDPMLWTAGDFISCEILPDQSVRPIKLNNYIAIFGTNSIEYFWDAGNTSGSPLQRNDTPVKFNGYLGGYAQWGNKAIFVGNNVEGQPDVFILQDLKMDGIGDVTLTRYLGGLNAQFDSYRGSMVAIAGHVFYVLYTGLNYTFVYDLTTKLWTRWGYANSPYFDMVGCVNVKKSGSYSCYFIRQQNGSVYNMQEGLGTDSSTSFTCRGITPNQTFDTYNQKYMSQVTVWCDRGITSTETMQLSWTDTDYLTFSTPRDINFFQERPSTDRLGRFRRRAFKWEYTGSGPFRIKGLEVKINMGTN
jgi:hypothetical protein